MQMFSGIRRNSIAMLCWLGMLGCLLATAADAVQPKRGRTYTGATTLGPWNYSFGGYVSGTTLLGPAISFKTSADGRHVVQIKTTAKQLGQPGYCGGDDLQHHQPRVTVKSDGSFSGKLVQHRSNPAFGRYTIVTRFSGKFGGKGKSAKGSFQIRYGYPKPSRCDEHGTFHVSTP